MSEKIEQSRLDELKAQASVKNGWMPAPDMDCDELLVLLAERDRLREALELAEAVLNEFALKSGPIEALQHIRAALKDTNPMSMKQFQQFRRSNIAEMRPYEPGEDITGISISQPDREAGSPKEGDMIARNPKNHADQWLVAKKYFEENFEAVNQ